MICCGKFLDLHTAASHRVVVGLLHTGPRYAGMGKYMMVQQWRYQPVMVPCRSHHSDSSLRTSLSRTCPQCNDDCTYFQKNNKSNQMVFNLHTNVKKALYILKTVPELCKKKLKKTQANHTVGFKPRHNWYM